MSDDTCHNCDCISPLTVMSWPKTAEQCMEAFFGYWLVKFG